MRSESRRRMGVDAGGGWGSIKRCQQRLWAFSHSQHGQVLAVTVTELPRKLGNTMATCEPAPGQGSGGKPGRAAGLAGWGVRGSVDVTAEAPRGGKLFPPVTSPGLCANLGTQCYHCEPVLPQGPPGDFLQALQLLALVALARNILRPRSVGWLPVVPELAVLMDDMAPTKGEVWLWGVKVKGFLRTWSRDLSSTPPLSGNQGSLLALSLSGVYCSAKQPS